MKTKYNLIKNATKAKVENLEASSFEHAVAIFTGVHEINKGPRSQFGIRIYSVNGQMIIANRA